MHTDIISQINYLEDVLNRSSVVAEVLRLAPRLELPNWYLGAGAVAQTVWNELHGFPLGKGILDCDIVYYDEDVSAESQQLNIHRGLKLFEEIPTEVDIVNEARVHLWYPEIYGKEIERYTSTEHAISTWPTTSNAVGVRYENNNFIVYAPFGLNDLLGMVVRPNKGLITRAIYEKRAERWRDIWPGLTITDWLDG